MQLRLCVKILEQVDSGLAGPLVCSPATVAQMRGCETPNQQVGYSNPEQLNSFFWSIFAA